MSNFEELLAKMCGRKDVAAQEKLYKIYAARVQSACRRYSKDNEEAQDFTQDAFMRIFDKIGKFRYSGEGSLGRWLVRVAVNMIIDRKRRRQIFGHQVRDRRGSRGYSSADRRGSRIGASGRAPQDDRFAVECQEDGLQSAMRGRVFIQGDSEDDRDFRECCVFNFAKARIELGMMIKEYVKING